MAKKPRSSNDLNELTPPQDFNRRKALQALGKYSALVGVKGVVILSAEDVVAQQGSPSCFRDCRQAFPPGDDRKQCYEDCRVQDLINNAVND